MNDGMSEIPTDTIAETENYSIWVAEEPDGETTYHLELGQVTVHFFQEEWDEFLDLIDQVEEEIPGDAAGDEGELAYEVELEWGTLLFVPEEWNEFKRLMEQVSGD